MTVAPPAAGRRPIVALAAAGVLLGVLSLASVPLRYDHANSGRYLLQVLRTADPELFPGDAEVEALGRFRSLFYDLLAVASAEASPDRIEDTVRLLYAGTRVATVLLAMALVQALGGDLRATLLIGVWCSFKQSPPVGGDSLFVDVMHHGSAAFLTGCGVLLALAADKRIWAGSLLGLTVFLHPLMGLHLGLCAVPGLILAGRRRWALDTLAGGAVFVASVALYAAAMSPPAMTAEEAAVFIGVKAASPHVSLSAQGALRWLEQGLVVALALAAAAPGRLLGERIVFFAVLSGAAAAPGISLGAEFLESPRLVQFQPLRAFVWIHFLAFVLLALAAARELRRGGVGGVLLMAVVVLSMTPTLWLLPVLLLALANLVCERFRLVPADSLRRVSIVALSGIVAATGCGWLLRGRLSSLETLRNPLPPLLGLLLILWAGAHLAGHRWRHGLAAVLVGAAVAGSAVYWHRYYDERDYPEWGSVFKDRVHPEWTDVRRWIAARTPKNARFVVAGGPGNFRTRALRTGLGEPASALAWVDPPTYLDAARRAAEVGSAHRDGLWDLRALADLAAAWRADYVLAEGDVSPSTVEPLVRMGEYRVYAAGRLRASSAP